MPSYEAGMGPVDIQVIDPLSLTQSDFVLKMYGETYGSKPGELVDSDDPRQFVLKENASKWELVNLTTNQSFISDAKIGDGNQQLFEDFGFQ